MNIPESLQLFYKADLVTSGIRKRFNNSPAAATISFYFLFNLILLIAAIRDNVVFSTVSRLGFLNDFGWWLVITLGFNVTLYTFLWLPGGIAGILSKLLQNKTIKLPNSQSDEKESLDSYIQKFFKSFASPVWQVISAALAVPYTLIFMLPDQRNLMTWQTTNEFSFWLVIVFWALYFFLGWNVVIRSIVAIFWFNRLFRVFDVDVKVLHPDNAGGLASLGSFGLLLVYVVATVVISSIIGDLSEALLTSKSFLDVITRPYSLAIYISYAIAAPLLFFAPLFVAHRAMKKAKDEFITKISDQFDVEMVHMETLLSGDDTRLKNGLSKLEELQKLHAIASKFPVWPYNTGNLARFLGAILSPFLVSLLSFAFEQLFK